MKRIQVLGNGSCRFKELVKIAEKTARELGIEYIIEEIKNSCKITEFGILITPGLAIDGDIKAQGRVPSSDEMKNILNTG